MFLIRPIFKWLVLSGTVIAVAYLVPGITVDSWKTALVVGIVLGLLNVFIKPILFFLTIPINILTLGLFGIILNALLFWFTAWLVSGFGINGFWAAFFGSLLVALLTWFASFIIDKK